MFIAQMQTKLFDPIGVTPSIQTS